jgi:5'-nucleotidase
MRWLAPLALLLLAAPLLRGSAAVVPDGDVVTLSIVATTDLHGDIEPRDGRGGLAVFGGYVRNVRAARAADGGAVLLVDSGDTFLGGMESGLSEGAIVIDAYDALGYTAAAIGNHEFDFGPADLDGARQALGRDPRGALKARAAQARFPYLAANLIDAATGRPVDWPNVRPSAIVTAAGVRVGLIGVMTRDALRATLAVNVQGLETAPLEPAVAAEAAKLRAAGAAIVVVVAHAGGACDELRDPADLASCDADAEIFRLARGLPAGLVDAIAAGHTHQAVAHEVAGVAIVQAFAHGRAFGRVDLDVDRRTGRVVRRTIHAPQEICARQQRADGTCSPDGALARYEGRAVRPDDAVEAAMAREREHVLRLRAAPLGVVLDAPLARAGDDESALGNLFADAERELTAGADVAINNNYRGGLRADLPAGPLTFGALYDAFPYDNRLVTLTLTGADLRAVLATEVRRGRRGALGVSGLAVRVRCSADGADVDLYRPTGAPVGADERLVVVAMDSLVFGPVFAPARRTGAAAASQGATRASPDAPVMREVVEDWLRRRGGQIEVREYSKPRWDYSQAGGCGGA